MLKYLGKRILSLIPVIIAISILLFFIMKSMPGDPVKFLVNQSLRPDLREAQEAMWRAKLGLDRSLIEQYFMWIGSLVKGDLGYSTLYKNDVIKSIGEPLRNSIYMNFGSLGLSFIVSIYVGVKSAVKRGKFFDSFWQVVSIVGISVPTFFVGMLLIYFFAIRLGWFPINGMPFTMGMTKFESFLEWVRYIILPAITLSVGSLAFTIRYVRNAMLDVLSKDYIRTARSKGLSEKVIIYSHAFRNALIPVVTVLASAIVGLFGGAIITEQVFSWNGIGHTLIRAINGRDYMVLLTMNLFYAFLSLAANVVMDIGYALVDPRIRLE